jgi:hypothetical protein
MRRAWIKTLQPDWQAAMLFVSASPLTFNGVNMDYDKWVEETFTEVSDWSPCPITGLPTRTYVKKDGVKVRQHKGRMTQNQSNRLFIANNPDLDGDAIETIMRLEGFWD